MEHVDKALGLFESKFNCAQAVFASFSEELGLVLFINMLALLSIS